MTLLFHALLIGACSGIIGQFYYLALPPFPLTAWWWQWGQRFEFIPGTQDRRAIFKAIWGCVDCISGHIGWIATLVWLLHQPFTWLLLLTAPFFIILAAATGWLSSKLIGSHLAKNKM